MKTSAEIVQATQLCKDQLLSLISGKILALRIYPFVDERQCQKWQDKLSHSQLLRRYSNAKDVAVTRIGMTLFETENDEKKLKVYLQEGKKTLPLMQKVFGRKNPIQLLMNSISNSWEEGVAISKLKNIEMNPGIIRSFEPGLDSGLPAHIDSLLKDLPNNDDFTSIQCQLAANLYFSIPKAGGELELWDYAPCKEELARLFNGSYDFIDTTKIPVPSQKITPRVGELILFRSNCIHSVGGSERGVRSAASCFIGYYEHNKPLTVWA